MTSQLPERMRTAATGPRAARWVPELLDILDERRVLVMRTAFGFVAVAALLTLPEGSPLDQNILVGLLVGVAAVALGAAVAFGLDAMDPILGGARHVRGVGANLLSEGRGAAENAAVLAGHLEATALADRTVHVGIMTLGAGGALAESFAVPLARELAALGNRVVLTDLRAASEGPGVAEVVFGQVSLGEAVKFEPDLTLARIGAGQELGESIRTHGTFLRNLPADIDLSFALLAVPATGGLQGVVEGLDHVFVAAERGATRRLDLVQVLEGLETTGVQTQVILVEPASRSRSFSAPVAPLVTTRAEAEALATHFDPSARDVADPSMLAEELRSMDEPPSFGGPRSFEEPPSFEETGPVAFSEPGPVAFDEPEPVAFDEPAPMAEAPIVAPPPSGAPIDLDLDLDPSDAEDDLDPDLLAQALLTGDIDIDEDEDEDRDDHASDGAFESAVGQDPDPTVPTPRIASRQDPPGPSVDADGPGPVAPRPPSRHDVPAPVEEPGPITGGALGEGFRQRRPGTPDDPSRAHVETAPTASVIWDAPRTEDSGDTLTETAPITRVVLDAAARELSDTSEPIGQAEDDLDDPLGMTAALHSFASERLVRDEDDDS